MTYKLVSENLSSLGMQGSSTTVNFTRYFDRLVDAKRAAQEDYRRATNFVVDDKLSWTKTCGEHRAVEYTTGDLHFVMYNIERVKVE